MRGQELRCDRSRTPRRAQADSTDAPNSSSERLSMVETVRLAKAVMSPQMNEWEHAVWTIEWDAAEETADDVVEIPVGSACRNSHLPPVTERLSLYHTTHAHLVGSIMQQRLRNSAPSHGQKPAVWARETMDWTWYRSPVDSLATILKLNGNWRSNRKTGKKDGICIADTKDIIIQKLLIRKPTVTDVAIEREFKAALKETAFMVGHGKTDRYKLFGIVMQRLCYWGHGGEKESFIGRYGAACEGVRVCSLSLSQIVRLTAQGSSGSKKVNYDDVKDICPAPFATFIK